MMSQLKRTLIWACGMMIAFQAAALARNPITDFPGGNVVMGKATFERRSTVVPFSICEGNSPCTKPTPYWSLVVQNHDAKFELNQVFALGSVRAPETVEVNGVLIRPGSQVAVQGTIEPVTPNYAIISDLKSITLVMDHQITHPLSLTRPTFGGWNCRSAEWEGPQIHAQVWFDSFLYHLRVLARKDVSGDEVKEIATLEGVDVVAHRDRVSFEGEDRQIAMKLNIYQKEGMVTDLPSILHINRYVRPGEISVPVSATIRLVCDRVSS